MGGRPAAHRGRMGEGRAPGIPATGTRRRFPWGASEPTADLANLGGDALRPAPVGAYPAGASAYGAEQMLGDVWEWTTSPLRPWPGFTPMIYERYSQPFFDGATTGCCAAAPGRSRRASCGRASATGTTRSAGRSSPASAWPGTSDVPSPRLARCTGIGRVAGAGPAERAAGAVVCAATAETRPDQRRRLGRRLLRQRASARRWRSAAPLWGDASFASVAPALRSGCVVAAVRSATIGMPIEPSASAPFTDGQWLLSHNGVVDRAVLPPSRGGRIHGRQRAAGRADLRAWPRRAGRHHRRGRRRRPEARLNILAANGSRLFATTWGDTLSVLRRADGVVLASEPYDDDPDWQEIPDRHLVEVVDRCRRQSTLDPLKGSS